MHPRAQQVQNLPMLRAGEKPGVFQKTKAPLHGASLLLVGPRIFCAPDETLVSRTTPSVQPTDAPLAYQPRALQGGRGLKEVSPGSWLWQPRGSTGVRRASPESAGTEGTDLVVATAKSGDLTLNVLKIAPLGNGQAAITYTLSIPATVTVRLLLPATGKPVRILAQDQPAQIGESRIDWDGKDEAGNAVAAGTYLCEVTARKEQEEVQIQVWFGRPPQPAAGSASTVPTPASN